MLFRNVIHDRLFESTTQVQVFQPDQVALILRSVNDRLNVCDTGEYRRDEADRADTGIINLLHSRKPPLNAYSGVHIVFEGFIQRIDRPGYRQCIFPVDLLQQIHVTQNKIGFGADEDIRAAVLQLFQDQSCFPICLFQRIIAIRNRTDDDLLPCVFPGIGDFRPLLYIHKAAPFLGMPGEAFHEGSVAILAGVRATHIRINGISAQGSV